MRRYIRSAVAVIAIIGFVYAASGFARQIDYDPYAPIFQREPEFSFKKEAASNFLTYPFELIRWPVSRSLLFIEKHHLDTKALWVYEQFINRGIHPSFGFVGTAGIFGGADFDLVRLAEMRGRYPDLKANAFVHYAHDVYFQTGGEVGWHDITGTGLGGMGLFMYERRPEEHFYGVGPRSSAGDGTSFRMETTEVGGKLLYQRTPVWKGSTTLLYRNINIGRGEDGGRGIIEQQFPAGSIAGLDGDQLLSFSAEILQDTRNHRELSTRGGVRRVTAGFHEGVRGSDARYFSVEAEASQYFRLGSDRRVLALRFLGEYKKGIRDGTVPFHQMSKLGGFGREPRISETLRAYDHNRFFDERMLLLNAEYRYAIWEHRDFRLDTAIFGDVGQVFGAHRELALKDFRESYGLGFRLSAANFLLLAVEAAHGREGMNVYVKTQAPF